MSDMTYSENQSDLQLSPGSTPGLEADAAAAGNQASLLHNFGVASLLVVAGVVISGFLLTSEKTESTLDLPAMPTAVWLTESAAGADTESWIDLADRALPRRQGHTGLNRDLRPRYRKGYIGSWRGHHQPNRT